MIRVVCTCGRVFKAEDRHAGKRTKCPVCGAALTIGQTPVSSSSGGDVEVPSWWYPSDPEGRAGAEGGAAGGLGHPNSSQTAVFPGGIEPKSAVPHGNRSRLPGDPPSARGPTAGAPLSRVRRLWVLSAGTAALAISALGFILWASFTVPGGGDAASERPGTPGAPGRSNDPGVNHPPSPSPRVDPVPASRSGGSSPGVGNPASDRLDPPNGAPPSPESPGPPAQPERTTGPARVAPAHAARRLRLLVPAYIYPSGPGRKEWQRLIDAASKVDIVAIANPSSGPGIDRNPDYLSIFTEAASRGVQLVGYISTQYAGRSRADVKNDIDSWIRFYPQIAGFFFDQQPREAQHTDYYAEIRDYAKDKLRNALVINNPGIPCDPAYLAQSVSDVTCVFANFEGFSAFELPVPLRSYDSARFAALPYNIADVEVMHSAVKDAIVKRIGYLFVSDVAPPNQWSRLPLYWEAEVEAISRLH